MATTSVAKPTTKCTESENDSDVETGSAAGTSHANVKKEEDHPSSELADTVKAKESVFDDRTLLNKNIVIKKCYGKSSKIEDKNNISLYLELVNKIS